MAKVSVIIPAYNQARFLSKAIESVLYQTYADIECIVVNDGSTDHTKEVASQYLSYPNYKLINQANQGVAMARNRGIQESSGEYLCFLDSDDFFHPDKVKIQAEFLENEPDYGFSYCDIVTVDEDGNPVEDEYSVGESRQIVSGDIFQSLMLGGYFPPHTVMVRRSVIETVGFFDRELGGHADYDLWLRIAGKGYRAYYLDQKLAYYRTYPGSMSRDGEHMAETLLGALKKVTTCQPFLTAEAILRLQTANKELFTANRWLQQNWESVYQKIGTIYPGNEGDGEYYSLINHFRDGKLIEGESSQVSVWEVNMGKIVDKAIFLQPPARLGFVIPQGAAGRFISAITIHPDAWDNPASGACIFTVVIDDRFAIQMSLDPTNITTDRKWHELVLNIPENTQGSHKVILETKPIGQTDYRWALFRDPIFQFDKQSSAAIKDVKEERRIACQ